MFMSHLRQAVRLLRREPGFTLTVLLTLALGVGANVAVFAVVEAALLRPLPYAGADRLVTLKNRDRRTGITKEFVAIGDYVDLAASKSSLQSLAGYGGGAATLFGMGDPFRVTVLSAAPGLLDTLGAETACGRRLQPDDSRPGAAPVVMLGYELWQSHFGADPGVVGRAVTVGSTTFQIVGVAGAGFHFPANVRTDVIQPMTVPTAAPAERKSDWIFAVGRLKPAGTLAEVNANLLALSGQLERQYPQSNQASEYFAVPMRDALVGETKGALWLLQGAVGTVLLIACTNVASLLVARAVGRRREMAVRLALGAGRARLAAQLLTETLTFASLAAIVGVVLAHWGARALVALMPSSVGALGLATVRINGRVLAFTLALSVATALFFGLASVFTVWKASAAGTLLSPSRVTMGAGGRRAAFALVVAEVALALVLLLGAGLIVRSVARLLAVDPGFRVDHVLTLDIAVPVDRYRDVGARRAVFDRIFTALRALPPVEEVGAGVVVPLTGNNWTVGFERADQPVAAGERPPDVGWQLASGGFFTALRIPLLRGRLFGPADRPGGHPVVVVSEAIERRFFPHDTAVGHLIRIGDTTPEIVGVVGDIRRASLRDERRSDLYFPFESLPATRITLFVRTATDPLRELPAFRAAIRSIEPDATLVKSETMAAVANESMQVPYLALWLLGGFAGIALVLAVVGIYGVVSYVVGQRTREIGTRVALGATRSDIVWLIMRYGAKIAALGTAVGAAVGLVATRSLESLLFGVSASDPTTIGTAAAVLVAATMAACYLPARRAASVDPARTIADA